MAHFRFLIILAVFSIAAAGCIQADDFSDTDVDGANNGSNVGGSTTDIGTDSGSGDDGGTGEDACENELKIFFQGHQSNVKNCMQDCDDTVTAQDCFDSCKEKAVAAVERGRALKERLKDLCFRCKWKFLWCKLDNCFEPCFEQDGKTGAGVPVGECDKCAGENGCYKTFGICVIGAGGGE
jgi:hypothetical protein